MIFHNIREDTINVLGFMDVCLKSMGIEDVDVNSTTVSTCIRTAKEDIHYPSTGGLSGASVFKQIATFPAYFVSLRPIKYQFPEKTIGSSLHRISNHQNAIMALEIAISSLHHAEINRKDGDYILKNRIEISKHSYVDIVDSVSTVTPQFGWKLVAVLLEQMTYRYNPECSYQK